MIHDTKVGWNRIVLISDIHYHLFQAFSPDGGRSRLADISSVVQQCADYCIKNNIKQVGILGDVFEKRGVIDSIVYNTFTSDLRKFLDAGITVYILAGNHDQDLISNASWDNSLQPLEGLHPNLHIFSEPALQKLGDVEALFVPYIHDTKALEQVLRDSRASYAFIHAGIAGAKLIDSDFRVKEGLELANFSNMAIFSGHYHTPQTIGNATYLGSPLHHSFNDEGQEKSFIDLDLSTGKFVRVPTKYPKFIRVQIDNLDDIYNIDSNDYYKLTVSEKLLSEDHHAHLQSHTKEYDVFYTFKKESENYYAAFDSDKQVLRKFIQKEFGQEHLKLYQEAKRYIC